MMNSTTSKAPTLCFIYVLLIFIPAELYWHIGPVRIEPYRIFLIISAFLLLPRIFEHEYDRKEISLLTYCALCTISLLYVHGGNGIQSALILILEVFVSYCIGLSIDASVKSLRKVITLILGLLLVLAPFGIAESTNGYRLFHVLFAELAGTETIAYLGEAYLRHGLHRASTIFAHPIIYSVIAMMYFGLLFRLYRPPMVATLSIGIFTAMVTSVTSAGILMLIVIASLYLVQKSTKYIPGIYKILVTLTVLGYVFLSFASNRGPVRVLIQLLSLNPETAYTRYLQWQFASIDIFRHPFFGIGFNEWTRPFWMPPSVDSYWLLTVLQNGFPALIALAIFFILSLRQYWIQFNLTRDWLYFSFFVSICAFVLAAFTVDYFDRAQFILFFTMGLYNSFVSKRITRLHASS